MILTDTLKNVKIRFNTAEEYGGGLYIADNQVVYSENTLVSNNIVGLSSSNSQSRGREFYAHNGTQVGYSDFKQITVTGNIAPLDQMLVWRRYFLSIVEIQHSILRIIWHNQQTKILILKVFQPIG